MTKTSIQFSKWFTKDISCDCGKYMRYIVHGTFRLFRLKQRKWQECRNDESMTKTFYVKKRKKILLVLRLEGNNWQKNPNTSAKD